ncbi:thioredoxin [Micrococcus luteus]|nr:thioredoxin [Micrococcus luteus]MBY0173603.1 thioredoxin [Micrococcus luteus]MBY0179720.1 thioredoxin [Micrococcus luteus]RZB23192.1 thioredoxin [Micrococcus luteus]TKD62349.1 thioredoxin [Micrococcus luteus]
MSSTRGSLATPTDTTTDRHTHKRRTHMATVELTEDNFEVTINQNDIVLVDFWADWCAPCHQFAPVFEKSSQDNPDIVHAKLDTESEQRITAAAQITAIPTLLAFRQGLLVFSQAGALPPTALAEVVENVRGLDMDEVRKDLDSDGGSAKDDR